MSGSTLEVNGSHLSEDRPYQKDALVGE